MQVASKESASDRRAHQALAIRPDSGSKQRSHDTGCGFVRFCHKHIFASPTAVSSASGHTRKVSQSAGTVMSNQSQCSSFNSHFNPCYNNSSPPDDDDDDDINLGAFSLCDSFSRSRTRKTAVLPAVSEMSESCFEDLQSSSRRQEIDLPRLFRPMSWAGPADDCLIDSNCTCCCESAMNSGCTVSGAQELNFSPASDEQLMSLSAETPFYWELEKSTGTNLSSQNSPLPESCQKLASPLLMGTQIFDTWNMSESSRARKMLTKKSSSEDTPKMGHLSARCFLCRDCQHVCSVRGMNWHGHALSGVRQLPPQIHIPRTCKCIKQRRCPTPPRMLSPCDDQDDSLRVPVADI